MCGRIVLNDVTELNQNTAVVVMVMVVVVVVVVEGACVGKVL